jgi:Tfp pilus assembly protein PilP
MLKQSLSMILVLVAGAYAQTAAPAKNTAAAKKPASQSASTHAAAKPAAPKPATTSAGKSTAAPKSSAKTSMPSPAKSTAPAKTQAAATAKPDAAKAAPTKTAGRRDPFVSPLRIQEDKIKQSSLCTTGARCLIIEQVELKGIVKTQGGMIAMVENAAKKQYNLREKDPVLNGQVLKITGDSLIFKETVTDNLGNQTTKEVVKKVTAPVI